MKRLWSVVMLVLLCAVLCACGKAMPKTTKSADDYIGMNYQSVMEEFLDAGFVNVQVNEVPDLTSNSELQDGDVGKVDIGGDSTFEEGTKFEEDVLVTITYHTIKKIKTPLSASQIQEYDSITIAEKFTDAGFTNVTTEEVYDLDPDVYKVEFENEVTINSSAHFGLGDEVVFDAEIKIICHKPYEKYSVKVIVDFIPNLLFNKYDVEVALGDEGGTLEHGEDGDFEYRLREGKYKLQFTKKGTDSVKAEVELDVYCDVEASYKIQCEKSTITVDVVYVDNQEVLADDEVKVMASKAAFMYENYKDAVRTLEEWGFTNIKEVPVYDIFWGITKEGSIASVTIDGIDTYNRGDIYKKDVEIVVTYHMKEEDDPSKNSETVPNETETIPSTYIEETETTTSVEPTPETTQKESEYEKAYIRDLRDYDLYYMFDTDTNTVICFGTNDTSVLRGTYSGDFSAGVSIEWSGGQGKETFIHKNGTDATLIDGNGFDWEYKVCSVDTAQKVLDGLQ